MHVSVLTASSSTTNAPQKTDVPPLGTIPIRIAGKIFNLSFSELDNLRRFEYFRNYGEPTKSQTVSLTSEENRLLEALQINDLFKRQFRQYLPNFFNNLQSCNSDTSIFLRNKNF